MLLENLLSLIPLMSGILSVCIYWIYCWKNKRWPEMIESFGALVIGIGITGGALAIIAALSEPVRNAIADDQTHLLFGGLAALCASGDGIRRLRRP